MSLPPLVSYGTPWATYGLAITARRDKAKRCAISSFDKSRNNKINIIDFNPQTQSYYPLVEFDVTYPATKLLFLPDVNNSSPDLFAASGDNLKLWKLESNGANFLGALSTSKSSDACSPITSFDWNSIDYNIIGTASIDTTCTIWDIEAQKSKTQLIAHDQEVFDITFGKTKDSFVSVSADGSVRMFDLRSLEHSTIIYDSPNLTPLLRVSWNRIDSNYIATFGSCSNVVYIIDIRMASSAVAELNTHTGYVSDIMWSPHSATHLLTSSQDKNVFIWDFSRNSTMNSKDLASTPVLKYEAPDPVQKIFWSMASKETVALTAGNYCTVLQV